MRLGQQPYVCTIVPIESAQDDQRLRGEPGALCKRSKVNLNGPRGAILRADLWDAVEHNRTSQAALLHARAATLAKIMDPPHPRIPLPGS